MKNPTTGDQPTECPILLSDLSKPGMVNWLYTSADGAQIGYCRKRRCLVAGYPFHATLVPMDADDLIGLSLELISEAHSINTWGKQPC